jgi:hypothetical protein
LVFYEAQMEIIVMAQILSVCELFPKGESKASTRRLTMRAPDGWWAQRFELDSSEPFFPFRWLVLPAAGNANRWALS